MQSHDVSLSRLLFQYLWPFWLFKDASHGDMYTQAAAYQHNREKRIYLPGYLAKWFFICALTLGLTSGFETLATRVESMAQLCIYLAACSGVGFAFGICVLMNMGYVYIYLSGHER